MPGRELSDRTLNIFADTFIAAGRRFEAFNPTMTEQDRAIALLILYENGLLEVTRSGLGYLLRIRHDGPVPISRDQAGQVPRIRERIVARTERGKPDGRV